MAKNEAFVGSERGSSRSWLEHQRKGGKKHPKMSPLPHGATETLANLLPERTKYSSLFFKPRNKRKDIYSVEQSETES